MRLQLEHLTIGYRQRGQPKAIARNLDTGVDAGELVCMIGPNGAGKSTLLRTIAAMHPPLSGRVTLDGVDLHTIPARERARLLAVVLTERATGGLLTANALVGLGRYPHTGWSGRLASDDHAQVERALDMVGGLPLADRFVIELSDGERQRVMLARALAQEARVLLLDEITAFLDLPGRVTIMHLLRRLTRESGRAILVSTHDIDLALQVADRIWIVSGDGDLVAGGPEDLALSGSFDALFAQHGLEFDSTRGTYSEPTQAQRTVELRGDQSADDTIRYWTERALRRAGFAVRRVDGPPAEIHLRLPATRGEPWEIIEPHGHHDTSSLSELAVFLREK